MRAKAQQIGAQHGHLPAHDILWLALGQDLGKAAPGRIRLASKAVIC